MATKTTKAVTQIIVTREEIEELLCEKFVNVPLIAVPTFKFGTNGCEITYIQYQNVITPPVDQPAQA